MWLKCTTSSPTWVTFYLKQKSLYWSVKQNPKSPNYNLIDVSKTKEIGNVANFRHFALILLVVVDQKHQLCDIIVQELFLIDHFSYQTNKRNEWDKDFDPLFKTVILQLAKELQHKNSLSMMPNVVKKCWFVEVFSFT